MCGTVPTVQRCADDGLGRCSHQAFITMASIELRGNPYHFCTNHCIKTGWQAKLSTEFLHVKLSASLAALRARYDPPYNTVLIVSHGLLSNSSSGLPSVANTILQKIRCSGYAITQRQEAVSHRQGSPFVLDGG